MKKRIRIVLLFLFAINCTATAQWIQSEQPTGGLCRSIEKVGAEIWACYTYSLYVSSNEGVTWDRHPFLSVTALDVQAIGDTVVMLIQKTPTSSTYSLSTITSFDGGITWSNPVATQTGNDSYTWGSRVLHVAGSDLIIDSNGDAYFISHDYGATWSTLALPGQYGYFESYSQYLLLHFNPLSPGFGNYYSTDGAQTWVQFDTTYYAISSLVIDSTIYIVSGYQDTSWHGFIIRTTDLGLTYDTLAENLINSIGYLAEFAGKILYTHYPYPQDPEIFESVDGGNTWTTSQIPPKFYAINDENAILLSNWDWLFGVGSVYRYRPSEGTSFKTETGVKSNTMTYLHENNGVLFAKANGTVYRSSNAAASWHKFPYFIDGHNDLTYKGDTIFALTRPVNGKKNLAFSFDNGLNWDTINPNAHSGWEYPESIYMFQNKLYVGNNTAFIGVSHNFGNTWIALGSNPQTIRLIQFVGCNGELFALGHHGDKVYKWNNFQWEQKVSVSSPGVSYDYLFSLDGTLVFRSGGSFYISTNQGVNWSAPTNVGFASGRRPSSLYSKDGIWYSPARGKIYYSFDKASNWQQLPTNTEMRVSANSDPIFAFHNDIMYAGGNNVWKSTDTLSLISGQVYVDWNNSGFKDSGEDTIPNHLLYTSPNNIAFNTDTLGKYMFLTTAVGDHLMPSLPSAYFSSNPLFYVTNGNATNVNFGLYCKSGIQDLSVDITNRNSFRPGFNTIMDVEVKNWGTGKIPGKLKINLDSSMTYVSSTAVPVSVSADSLEYNVDSLLMLQSQRISIEVLTNASASIMDSVKCIAKVFPIVGDTVPTNNVSIISEQVVGSFDPNDKSASYDPFFSPAQLKAGVEMEYIIRFQNTGNFSADFVRIVDTLSSFIDVSTFRIISSSHEMNFEYSYGNVVTFYFDNINLPDSSSDEPNSHGYVKYAVKFFPDLLVGTGIVNTAHIYFDFNAPITTNTVSTLIADPPLNIGISEIKSEMSVFVFPNPVAYKLYGRIMFANEVQNYTIHLMDVSGKLILEKDFNEPEFEIDVSSLGLAVYYGRIITENDDQFVTFRLIVVR